MASSDPDEDGLLKPMQDAVRVARAHLMLTLDAAGGRMDLGDLYANTAGRKSAVSMAFWSLVKDGTIARPDDNWMIERSPAPSPETE